MKIGVPRERKTLERRVALTPDGAAELIRRGNSVLIEKGAGVGSFFPDAEYAAAGARIVASLEEVWCGSDLVVKVKEPAPEEFQYFRPGLLLFDYLHLASSREVTDALIQGQVTSIAYELVRTPDNRLPLLEPMSEIAGKLSVQNGASHLLSQNGGRGVLLGGALGVRPAYVVILGAGIAGRAACEVALGFGARVSVLDIDVTKLDILRTKFSSQPILLYSTSNTVAREIEQADLVIGAVLIPGAAAPKLVTEAMVKKMKEGAVIVDISVDQGGCIATTEVTSLKEPTVTRHGVIHYGVPNMPAQTPRTSTLALTAATLPYISALAQGGVAHALKTPEYRGAINTHQGKLVQPQVGEALGMRWEELS